MKSFLELSSQLRPLNQTLEQSQFYYAHLPDTKLKETEAIDPETLEEHLKLVLQYFLVLCEQHKLDKVVDNLINDLLPASCTQEEEVKNYLKSVFLDVIWFHDFGKVNHLFQQEKMKNSQPHLLKVKHSFGSDHARISAYLFLMYHFNKSNHFNADVTTFLDAIIISFSYNIAKHHASSLENLPEYITFGSKDGVFSDYLPLFSWSINKEDVDFVHELIGTDKAQAFNEYYRITDYAFPLFALLKLNFSLLTASDYYATMHYMNNWSKLYSEFGIIEDELRSKIISNATTKQSYNQSTYNRLEELLETDEQLLTEPKPENLNLLRAKMAAEVIANIRQYTQHHLFYLEAPTGGGKTNMSMLAVAELLDASEGLNKVFYVFPFTTLITQTYSAITETLGLTNNEITQLHSKAGWQAKSATDEADAYYGQEKKNFIDNLFVNYPVTLLSHVLFFDIIKTNKKERNYLLHRLANSIVVVDELQSYNPQHWDKLIYFISHYAKAFNMKFILMSATLPKLGNLQTVFSEQADFVSLLPNAIPRFFKNPNFGERVNFNFELLESTAFKKPDAKDKDGRKEYLIKLCKFLNEQTQERQQTYPDAPVRTVIEFIYKKTASEFYKIANKRLAKCYNNIFVLSGTILESRRKEIINFLKGSSSQNVLLITTQVVEAGVDIDMDLGFKDVSLLDSEEQLAGRINRNVNKAGCQLFLFDLDDANIIYGKDSRYKQQNQESFRPHLKRILTEKAFDELYNKVLNIIDNNNRQEYLKNFNDYEESLQKLNFPEAERKFRLIEEDSISVFVPVPVPVSVAGKESGKVDKIFTGDELAFLKAQGIEPAEYLFGDEYILSIDGTEVFQLYKDLINRKRQEKRSRDFIQDKLMAKCLQGIMSKFVFSVLTYSKTYQELKIYGQRDRTKDGTEYGFFYLENTEAYDYYSGIKDELFEQSNFM